MGLRYAPFAFTEQGVAQLSGVLTSERAIAVNIQIIRLFTSMREFVLSHKDLLLKMEQIEEEVSKNSSDIQVVFDALRQLLSTEKQTIQRKEIGYKGK